MKLFHLKIWEKYLCQIYVTNAYRTVSYHVSILEFFLPVLKALHSDKNAKHYKLEFKQFTTIELNLKKGGM